MKNTEAGWKNRDMKHLREEDWWDEFEPWAVALILCISLFMIAPFWAVI